MAATEQSVKNDIEAEKERLALLRLRRSRSDGSEPLDIAQRTASGTSRGVAKLLGTPVDVVNQLGGLVGADVEEPIGGSMNLQRVFQALGVGRDPAADLGRAGVVGEVVGMSAPAAMGMVAGGARSATGALSEPAKIPSVFTQLTRDVARTAYRNPVTFYGLETASAATAGLARYEAMQRFPNSPGAQAFAELLGGLTPAATLGLIPPATRATISIAERLPVTGIVVRSTRRFVTKPVQAAVETLRPAGAKRRAEARVGRAVADPMESLSNLRRTDILPEAREIMTPAARSGDPGLLALERSVIETSEELGQAAQQNFAEVNRAIRDSLLEGPTKPVPLHQVREYFTGLMDTRIQIAAQRVEEQMAALGPRATRADLNRLARIELQAAKTAAREQEKQLYRLIPDDAVVPTEATRDLYQSINLSTPRALQGDIPDAAKKFLTPKIKNAKGKLVDNPNYLGDDTTIDELRGLQTKLRDDARAARSEGRFNAARIADDIAESIKDDIANATNGEDTINAVQTAVSFSRDLNQRFTKNPVISQLLGRSRTGGPRVMEGMTLETTVGTRGPRAAEATDALLEAVRRNGDEPAMRQHIEGFLIDDFRRAAVEGGRIDEAAARNWISNNSDALDRFPELRRSIDRASRATGELIEAERAFDPRVSRAAVFLNATPDTEIERVINTAEPAAAMKELVRLARTDPTREAETGLKQAFTRMLFNRSKVAKTDFYDMEYVSGAKLTDELSRTPIQQSMRELFTPDEITRIEQARKTALLLDAQRRSGKSAEGVIGDTPALLLSILTRTGAAQVGRKLAVATGGGTVQTPGILASEARKLLQAGVTNVPERLLTDAITATDDELFRALLLPLDSQQNVREVHRQMHAWVLHTLAEQNQIEGDE
jgi:hypothetical protein